MEQQISLNPQKSYRDPSTSSDEDENGNQSQPGNTRQAETTKLIRQAKEQTAMLAQQKALLNESLQAEENNEEDEIQIINVPATPAEVVEIPDEDTSEEEHTTELEVLICRHGKTDQLPKKGTMKSLRLEEKIANSYFDA
jgi:hypothetical protein